MSITKILKQNFKNINELEKVLKTNQDCIRFLEELIWEGIPVSPFDKSSKVYKCKNGRYKCKNTGKYFTVLTGSIFENAKLPILTWFRAIYFVITLRKGVPSTTLANILGVTQKTAWFMLQKIRKAMEVENNHKLEGIVEADEFVAGGLLKNMHYDKKLQAKQKGSYQNKTPLHGMVERKGNAVINVVPNTEADVLNAKILKHVKIGSTLYTDENQGYKRISHFYNHDYVVHSKGNYVQGNISTNTIECVWATLARTLNTYIRVSKKFLQNYANECVFRYNTRKMKHIDACIWLLQNIASTKVTWKEIQLGQY